MSVFTELTESDINFSVASLPSPSSFAFAIELLDADGVVKVRGAVVSWHGVEEWLKKTAVEYFPDSKFASIHGVVARFG